MATSADWWAEVKASPEKFNEWLLKQYVGEVTACKRIMGAAMWATDKKDINILMRIAIQEGNHGDMVRGLLEARKIRIPEINQDEAEKRYWATVKKTVKDFATAMAIAAHAEKMRLERIQTIAGDEDAPEDIRNVFKIILKEELWHERAFREMAGEQAMNDTIPSADEGRRVLGLEP